MKLRRNVVATALFLVTLIGSNLVTHHFATRPFISDQAIHELKPFAPLIIAAFTRIGQAQLATAADLTIVSTGDTMCKELNLNLKNNEKGVLRICTDAKGTNTHQLYTVLPTCYAIEVIAPDERSQAINSYLQYRRYTTKEEASAQEIAIREAGGHGTLKVPMAPCKIAILPGYTADVASATELANSFSQAKASFSRITETLRPTAGTAP